MAVYVVIKPNGTRDSYIEPSGKFSLRRARELIGEGCTVAERIRVRYGGKVRDCWLDEEGLLRARREFNKQVKLYAEAYYDKTCQEFVGNGVIWIPGDTSVIV